MSEAIDFLNDDDIKQYFIRMNPLFKLSDVPDYVRKSSAQMLALKTDTIWEISNDILYADGIGANCIACPRVPIVELTDITIILANEEEISLRLTGEDRQVEWDKETGIIRLLQAFNIGIEIGLVTTFEETGNEDEEPSFPCGLQNVRITGVFGTDCQLFLLKFIQLLLMSRAMQMMDSKRYKYDLVKEKIGRYEYKLMEGSSNNNRMTLDGYIDYLCGLLPKEESFAIEAL